MTTRKTYDVLADAFQQEGVSDCFALLGDASMYWATRLAERGARMIYVRHEHCAVAAAMANARASGRVGVATVTCGPGLTQIATALPAAVRSGIALVIFGGEAPLKSNWYNQQIDQASFIQATGAAYHQLHLAAGMPVQVRDAFLQAQEEQRPVVLGIPFNLQEADWHGEATLPPPSREILPRVGPIPPHPDDIARAADLVNKARRIIVMAGRGAHVANAAAACRALAEKCDALLATTLPARGMFPDDPFCLGVAGGFSSEVARECFAEADLVIAVGTILAHHNADGGKLFGDATVLQIDTAPRAVSQGRVAADAHIRADARLGVEALSEAVTARNPEWRTEALAHRIRDLPADSSRFAPEPALHDPRDVVSALEAALPADWEMVNSSGHCSFYFAHMPSRPVDRFLTIREFGAIGNGISFAIGVAVAKPDSTVVLFDGDRSLLMHIQELETIRRHGLKVVICVMNDGAYGSEIRKLRAEGLSDAGAVFGRTEFAEIAHGFGLPGARAEDLSDLSALAARAVKAGACVWDFPVSDKVVSPVIRRSHPQHPLKVAVRS